MKKIKNCLPSKTMVCLLAAYILNCTDLLFTYTFLKTGLFSELNPVMRYLLHFPVLTLILKILIPALLLIYLFYSFDLLTPLILLICRIFSFLLLVLYAFLNSLHLYYLFQFLMASS